MSIITVCRNDKKHVEQTICSVLNQTYSDIEYIVVDGASDDGTMEIVNKYNKNIAIQVSEPDDGIYDAMNKGVKLASGDIVGFINAGDFLSSNDVIECIVNKFFACNANVVYGNKEYVDPENIDRTVRYWKAGRFDRKRYHRGWMTPHLSTYIRRDLYNSFGYFSTDLRIAADYELMLRILYKGNIDAVYLNKTIAVMRAGGISNGSLVNLFRSNWEVMKAWRMNGLDPPPFILFEKPLRKLFQRFEVN